VIGMSAQVLSVGAQAERWSAEHRALVA